MRFRRFNLSRDVAKIWRGSIDDSPRDDGRNNCHNGDAAEQDRRTNRQEISRGEKSYQGDASHRDPRNGQSDEQFESLLLPGQRLQFPFEDYFSHDAPSIETAARRESRAATHVSMINTTSVAAINHLQSF